VDKRSVAHGLEQIAALLELKGENPFRVRAFRTAAKAVAALTGELADHLADGSLAATKGVGPATLQIVQQLATTGRSSLHEELREQVPAGLVEMLQISGLGVAKVRQLHEALGIDSWPNSKPPRVTAASRSCRASAPAPRRTSSRASPSSGRRAPFACLTMQPRRQRHCGEPWRRYPAWWMPWWQAR